MRVNVSYSLFRTLEERVNVVNAGMLVGERMSLMSEQ